MRIIVILGWEDEDEPEANVTKQKPRFMGDKLAPKQPAMEREQEKAIERREKKKTEGKKEDHKSYFNEETSKKIQNSTMSM